MGLPVAEPAANLDSPVCSSAGVGILFIIEGRR
jgi:hypothetical protein